MNTSSEKMFYAVVKNVPDGDNLQQFIVARWCDESLWFYGSYASERLAKDVAAEIGNGVVLSNLAVGQPTNVFAQQGGTT